MPPTLPRKRLRADSSSHDAQVTKSEESTPTGTRRKATLYDDLDATSTSNSKNSKAFLESLDASEDESSLSSLSDADFEDVPLKRQKVLASDDDSDEDVEFEDVEAPRQSMIEAPGPSGDLELTLYRDTRVSLTNPFGEKKGPSKVERKVRNATHCMHVQSLLWHNAIRNAWVSDTEVQAILMSHVPPRLFDEVDRWRRASGVETEVKERKGSKVKMTYGRAKDRDGRDWGAYADGLEEGAVDMSNGDPLFRLVKSLSSWWKQRFKITALGLRKQGYMSLERIDRYTKAWAAADYSSKLFGERIGGREEFRRHAMDCSGSRDVGAQLFTALLRALGLETRMVASLQPLGFGWTKLEEADPEKDISAPAAVQWQKAESAPSQVPSGVSTPKSRKRDKSETLNLEHADSDDESVVEMDMTPTKPSVRSFDKDLEYPHYWTEVFSPVTKTWLPVDPIVKKVVATNRGLIEALEPRGGKADRSKQVMAYVVGYSQDGTAKDVTVRYLKQQMLPGRTKGMRMPVEKVPVYNRHGKVKRYEHHNWFKRALSSFARGTRQHPITEMDELEDSTDLKPVHPEKKEVKEGEETLQYYKQSKEFCLERHLKREEALLPDSKPVRTFKNKGKAKSGDAEPVYLRKDIVQVKSAETWHKQGRAPLPNAQPLKRVPYRAATTNKRREIAAAEALSGEKVLQGLYSFDQTDWIIPPPIRNGVIPKNEYGNIDLFVEHMCPEGAVHVPFRGAVRVCKRLQIDYAEAVVGFEFGHRMAVPVIQGIVCAEEYHDQAMEELRKDETERARKEDEKRRKEVLRLWSKFIKGLRIVERVRQDYGHIRDDVEVFGRSGHGKGKTEPGQQGQHDAQGEDMEGGFLPDGYNDEYSEPKRHTSSFFPVVEENDEDGPDDLVVEHGEAAKPISMPRRVNDDREAGAQDVTPKTKPKPKGRQTRARRSRRQKPETDEGEDESEDEYMEDD